MEKYQGILIEVIREIDNSEDPFPKMFRSELSNLVYRTVKCPTCNKSWFENCVVISKTTGEVVAFRPDRPHRSRVNALKELGFQL